MVGKITRPNWVIFASLESCVVMICLVRQTNPLLKLEWESLPALQLILKGKINTVFMCILSTWSIPFTRRIVVIELTSNAIYLVLCNISS